MLETIPNNRSSINKEEVLLTVRNYNFTKLADYLESTDFFSAPASTMFHEAFASGLFLHSMRVAYFFNRLLKEFNIIKFLPSLANTDMSMKDKQELTALVIALSHDICKIDFYTTDYRNVKQPDGSWQRVPYFRAKKETGAFGHGVESVRRLRKLISEEDLDFVEPAILFHMGAYDLSKYQEYSYNEWTKKDPLVLLLHHADMLAANWFTDEKPHPYWS